MQEFYAAADRALPATLRPLVAALLPVSVAYDPARPDRPQHIDTGQGPVSPADVWSLCQFILALLQVCVTPDNLPGCALRSLSQANIGDEPICVGKNAASLVKANLKIMQQGYPGHNETGQVVFLSILQSYVILARWAKDSKADDCWHMNILGHVITTSESDQMAWNQT